MHFQIDRTFEADVQTILFIVKESTYLLAYTYKREGKGEKGKKRRRGKEREGESERERSRDKEIARENHEEIGRLTGDPRSGQSILPFYKLQPGWGESSKVVFSDLHSRTCTCTCLCKHEANNI
jgi:hypothetical protein